MGMDLASVPSSVMRSRAPFRIDVFRCFINLVSRGVWCVHERAHGLGGAEARTRAIQVLALGLTSKGLTPGPAFGSLVAASSPVVIVYRVLARGTAQVCLPWKSCHHLQRTQDSVTDAHQAFAWLGQPGSDPLLSQLLRCLGFSSFWVMIALSGQGFHEEGARRGQNVNGWCCVMRGAHAFSAPAGAGKGTLWGPLRLGLGGTATLGSQTVSFCVGFWSSHAAAHPGTAPASVPQSQPRDSLPQPGSKGTRPDVTRGLRPSALGLPVTHHKPQTLPPS